MGDFANGPVSRVFSMILSLLVIAVNTYFVLTYVVNLGITSLALIELWELHRTLLPRPIS